MKNLIRYADIEGSKTQVSIINNVSNIKAFESNEGFYFNYSDESEGRCWNGDYYGNSSWWEVVNNPNQFADADDYEDYMDMNGPDSFDDLKNESELNSLENQSPEQ